MTKTDEIEDLRSYKSLDLKKANSQRVLIEDTSWRKHKKEKQRASPFILKSQ
jgi:hypothetical protein